MDGNLLFELLYDLFSFSGSGNAPLPIQFIGASATMGRVMIREFRKIYSFFHPDREQAPFHVYCIPTTPTATATASASASATTTASSSTSSSPITDSKTIVSTIPTKVTLPSTTMNSSNCWNVSSTLPFSLLTKAISTVPSTPEIVTSSRFVSCPSTIHHFLTLNRDEWKGYDLEKHGIFWDRQQALGWDHDSLKKLIRLKKEIFHADEAAVSKKGKVKSRKFTRRLVAKGQSSNNRTSTATNPFPQLLSELNMLTPWFQSGELLGMSSRGLLVFPSRYPSPLVHSVIRSWRMEHCQDIEEIRGKRDNTTQENSEKDLNMHTSSENSTKPCLYLIQNDRLRGIHIPNLDFVVSLGLPSRMDEYLHLAGRCGREDCKDKTAIVLSVVTIDDYLRAKSWEVPLGVRFNLI